jgi:tRNA threonylcarbamoyl adenosine modification protein YeaZ
VKAAPHLTVAIEAAISGGSVSLLRGTAEMSHWIGEGTVAKAEELLDNIDQLFKSNNVTLDTIQMVAVSVGPGSFTGIRIGIATALGIKNGLGIRMSGTSVLRAMAMASDIRREEVTVAVPVGRGHVCFQSFGATIDAVIETAGPETLSSQEFDRFLRQRSDHNLAYAVGVACQTEAAMPEPVFVSKGTR